MGKILTLILLGSMPFLLRARSSNILTIDPLGLVDVVTVELLDVDRGHGLGFVVVGCTYA